MNVFGSRIRSEHRTRFEASKLLVVNVLQHRKNTAASAKFRQAKGSRSHCFNLASDSILEFIGSLATFARRSAVNVARHSHLGLRVEFHSVNKRFDCKRHIWESRSAGRNCKSPLEMLLEKFFKNAKCWSTQLKGRQAFARKLPKPCQN